jgi:hypothetical protein
MPRRTRNTRKKDAAATSAADQNKMATIARDMERESIDSLLNDFDVQTAALTKQALREFEKKAKLLMSALPMKSSIPKEILKMDLAEFIRRGGSFQSVWESLKREKEEPCSAQPEVNEGHQENTKPEPGTAEKDTFITPAMSTRRYIH